MRYTTGLAVKKKWLFNQSISFPDQVPSLTQRFFSKRAYTFIRHSFSSLASLSCFFTIASSSSSSLFSRFYMSFFMSSEWMISMSLIGSTSPSL